MTPRPWQAVECREVLWPIALTDGFEHFHADDRVVVAGHVAIVGEQDSDLIGESCVGDAAPVAFSAAAAMTTRGRNGTPERSGRR